MTPKKLLQWSQCSGATCPSVWIDEISGDYIFQGYKLTLDEQAKIECPQNEELIRLPADFVKQIRAFLGV